MQKLTFYASIGKNNMKNNIVLFREKVNYNYEVN